MTVEPAEFRDIIRRPDEASHDAARERFATLDVRPPALGRLVELGSWLASVQAACPPHPLDRARVVVFAADHGSAVHAALPETDPSPISSTAQRVRAISGGRAVVNGVARTVGADVRVVDIAVDDDLTDLPADVLRYKTGRGCADIAIGPAMTAVETLAAFDAGIRVADDEIDAGADVLIPGGIGVGSSLPSAALVGLLTNHDAAAVTGRGSGIDDPTWMRKAAAVRDAMRRARPNLASHLELLASAGGPDLAALTGFLLQASARRTPVLLDGVVPCAAGLVAHRMAFRSSLWWVAGCRSDEPAQQLALARLQLTPVIDQPLRLGDGTGGLLALPLLRAAQSILGDS